MVFVKGRGGIGKSVCIKKTLINQKADYVEITGDVTEAYLYRLLFENNGKVIWFRDVSKLLSAGAGALNKLKAATETEKERVLTKGSYSKQQADLPDRFLFKGRLIFDFNHLSGVGRSLRADFDALISRGEYIPLSFSKEDIITIMRGICKDEIELKITNELIHLHEYNGENMLNLRTQWHAFNSYEYAQTKGFDWKVVLRDELKRNETEVRRQLNTLIGKNAVKSSELKKLIIKSGMIKSLTSANRKINEWLITGEIFKVSQEERNFNVCLIPLEHMVYEYGQ